MSPVIRACEKSGLDYFILHTGQHYTYNLDRIFFEQLELPEAQYNLDVGSGTHGEQTGKILAGVEQVLQEEQPDVVLVEGDTNTVLAGVLAATKLHIKVGHVGPGLRSYDRQMPEEINRVLTEHFLFQNLGKFTQTASLNDNWNNPFGDGRAGERIVGILKVQG
jgi:UDP-N-acetylglucosamine 2-epimerase (non-hydrolysing)